MTQMGREKGWQAECYFKKECFSCNQHMTGAGEGERNAEDSDDNKKLKVVACVLGREFRLVTCLIVFILFLAYCFLFIIYYIWMLFLS